MSRPAGPPIEHLDGADSESVDDPLEPIASLAPSWWTTAAREHFSQRALTEHDRMRRSKESRLVPLRLLQ